MQAYAGIRRSRWTVKFSIELKLSFPAANDIKEAFEGIKLPTCILYLSNLNICINKIYDKLETMAKKN